MEEVAAKVGKSKAYVYQRLSLTRLAPQVRDVVATDALERCFRPLGGEAKYSREWLEPIGRLQEWLAEHARLDHGASMRRCSCANWPHKSRQWNKRRP
jgi:hypothetical protein